MLHHLFPTAIMEFDLSAEDCVKNIKDLIDTDKTVQAVEHGVIDNGYSSHGADKHILDVDGFADLKEVFQRCVNEYAENMAMGDLDIIQSWYNVYMKGGKIGSHRHEGSVCSAAFYPHAEEGSANIQFHSPLKPYRMNEIFHEQNYLNTYFAEFPAKQNTLYVFPSWLEHETLINYSSERYVISFNTQRIQQ